MRSALIRWWCAIAAGVAAVPATAVSAPHTRTGLCVGVGLGYESVAYSDQYGRQPAEGSGTGTARIGYAFKPDLVGGIEFWGWSKEYSILADGFSVPIDVKLSATTLAVTYFPGAAGFFARIGAGLAYGRFEINPPSGVTSISASSRSETGFAFGVAPGYEWRIAQRLALGFQGDVVYLGLNDVLDRTFGYGLSAQFNWYW